MLSSLLISLAPIAAITEFSARGTRGDWNEFGETGNWKPARGGERERGFSPTGPAPRKNTLPFFAPAILQFQSGKRFSFVKRIPKGHFVKDSTVSRQIHSREAFDNIYKSTSHKFLASEASDARSLQPGKNIKRTFKKSITKS